MGKNKLKRSLFSIKMSPENKEEDSNSYVFDDNEDEMPLLEIPLCGMMELKKPPPHDTWHFQVFKFTPMMERKAEIFFPDIMKELQEKFKQMGLKKDDDNKNEGVDELE